MINNRSTYVKIFSFSVLIGSLIALTVCLTLDIGERNIIALLPLAYCCCYFCCFGNWRYLNNISLSIINISAFCRYIIYPIIIATTIASGEVYEFNNKIVWLLIYELIGVFLVIGLFAKKIDVPIKNKFRTDAVIGIPNTLLMISLVPIIMLFPSLLTRFSISSDVVKTASITGIVEVIFIMGTWVLFLYLLARLSSVEYRFKGQKIVSFILVIAVALYYILFNSINGEDVKRWQIIACGIAMIYIVIKLFPEKKNIILIGGTAGMITAIIIGSFIKFGVTISLANFIDTYFDLGHFTEYFGGMRNISTALDVFESNSNAQGIQSTLTDLFSGVPILSALFDYSSYATPPMFQEYVNRTDIICPLTAQSIVHFGYIGTPVLAMTMTYLAIVFNRALKRTNSLYSAYVLVELTVFFSLFIELNTTIILGKLWIRLMFLALQPFDSMTKFKIRWRGF